MISSSDTLDIKAILKEYEFNDDIFCDEDERVHLLKYKLSKLSVPDRIIFCLYLDQASSRKVGKLLGVSHSAVLKEVHRIKESLLST